MTFQVGDSASYAKTITEADITLFIAVCGDTNPVHIDAVAAAKSRFGRRIAHGMLGASLISTVLGTKIPGPGTVYLGQSLKFLAPVFIGDTITATVTITKVRPDKPIFTLATTVSNQDGADVVQGEAVAMLPAD
jgi:3-hydroxybutyryl-CoA dehydratase